MIASGATFPLAPTANLRTFEEPKFATSKWPALSKAMPASPASCVIDPEIVRIGAVLPVAPFANTRTCCAPKSET
jgi:hypothetical protein